MLNYVSKVGRYGVHKYTKPAYHILLRTATAAPIRTVLVVVQLRIRAKVAATAAFGHGTLGVAGEPLAGVV